jgi:DNA ligase-1
MTKKKQTSLASFFAGGKGNGGNKASSKPKSKSKPTTKNTNDNAATSSRDETKKDLKRKETMTPLKDMDEEESKEKTNMLVDTDDEDKEVDEEQQNNDSSPTTEKESTRSERRSKKAKLVIDDDDDDDDEIEKDHEIDEEEEEEEEEEEHDDNNYDEDIETEDMMDDEEDADDDDEEEEDDDDVGKEEEVKKEVDDEDDEKMPLTSLSKAFSKSKTNSKKNSKPKKNIKNVSASSSSSSTTTTTTITNTTFKEWKENTPVSYSTLTETLSSIEAITGRLEIQNHLTQLFNECIRKYPTDLITIVYLASNSVAPAYDCVELGIGDAILIKAVAEASGSTPTMIKQKYESHGDLGSVAMNAKGKQRTLGFGRKPKPLDANEVLNVYRQIAAISGSQSQKMKVDLIKGLLVRATQKGNESKYIIRGLQGKLRIGLAQSTVLISLAHAVLANPVSTDGEEDKDDESEEELPLDCQNVKNLKLPKETRVESAISIVKKAYSEVSSYDALVEALVTKPLWQLHKFCTLRPGNPVTPMLAKPTKSILEVLKRLNGKRFTCEYKYDGERAQVHMKDDGVTKVFSRSLLDTSEKFPEVPLYVKEACVDTVQSFILDTEVVAYNRETKQFVPFQVLSTRKKTEESDDNAKVKVIVQAFDLMYLNGQSLLDHTLAERRDLLLKNFNVVDGKFQYVKYLPFINLTPFVFFWSFTG